MERKNCTKPLASNLILSLFVALVLTAATGFTLKSSDNQSLSGNGIFSYTVNGKIYNIDNIRAEMRNTTGGRKQLSLSNDRFVKFFFINPEIKEFDLSTQASKEAIVRYNEPGTNLIYIPKAGHVKIKQLDENSKVLTGEFELELVMPGKDKVIRITQGQFNVPIEFVR